MKIKIAYTFCLLLIAISCSIRTAPAKEDYIGNYYLKTQNEKLILKITNGDRYHIKLEGFGDFKGKIIDYSFDFDHGANIQLKCHEKNQDMRLTMLGNDNFELLIFNKDEVKIYLKKIH